MRISTKKILAFMIAVIMLIPILTNSLVASAATEKTFVLDAQEHLTSVAANSKKDGESEKAGTDNYFTMYYAAKTKIDTSSKSFSDGYNSAAASILRINFQTKTVVSETKISAAVGFTTSSAATIKLWWVQGGDDNRKMAIYDASGSIVAETNATLAKNDACISTLDVDEAGTYYIGVPDGSNYLFRAEVTEHDYVNTNNPVDWSTVRTPVVTSATDIGGALQINVNAQVGKLSDGIYADKVTVTVRGGDVYKEYTASSVADGETYNCEISPEWSGTYAVIATISREGSEDKVSAEYFVDYQLPLKAPYLSSATSKGEGTVELEYTEVREAEKYEIYCDNVLVAETEELSYLVTGLEIGTEHSFAVSAVRGEESKKSNVLKAEVTAESKATWSFTYYGPSTNQANNGYVGNLNEDGKVTVYSEGGKGKIQLTSTDGIAFYYTKVPTSQNFTMRATVTVNSWTLSNGQEGFGLLVTDRLGTAGDTSNFWNNQYMAGTTKIEYKYDYDEEGNEYFYETSYQGGTKYTMKLGLGMVAKTGITKDNLAGFEAQDTDVINKNFVSQILPLETGAADSSQQAGTYNAIANYTQNVIPEGNLGTLLETFVLEIQRNNTGYFIRYYDTEGNLIREIKNYDPEALDQLDSEYVYAGFFASRNARATFSNVEFTTIDPALDAPAESRPITYVYPELAITSAKSTTESKYTLIVNSNVAGTVKILDYDTGKVIVDEKPIEQKGRLYIDIDLDNGYGEYDYYVVLKPDKNQTFDNEYIQLGSTSNLNEEFTVTYEPGNYHRMNVYVSPDGNEYGNGSKEDPFDILTAIRYAVPGQTIILMEGTYLFNQNGETLKIERGIDGTADAPIRLIADPEAKTRPVFDFGGKGYGMTHGGNYWYFEGFDVTGSANAQKGFQVSGSYNTLVDIHAYRNGNTGIQLSRYSSTDYTQADWPSYNLVLNCDSYYNADAGYEDADGFAAKLTCGPGNVFDGCVAYNNADDGWDLYAKVETGAIGAVTIKNCVAYRNGYLEDGRAGGNGNGFKMGGSSISGHHVLINSIAFENLTKGIDCNSCPDIEVYNSISFNNGSYNVAFYTNDVAHTAFKASGIISFKTNNGGDEQLKGKGTQVESDYINTTNYYWLSGSCMNSAGGKLDPSVIFVSLEFKGVSRNADGTINLGDFLKIKEGTVPEGVGTTGASTPSPETTLREDLECTYPDHLHNEDAEYHWYECECGNRMNIEKHNFEYVIDVEPTETEVGYRHQECTECGYKKTRVEIQPIGKDEPTAPDVTPDVTPEEPATGFDAIWQMILDFFAQIVEWFKGLFATKE